MSIEKRKEVADLEAQIKLASEKYRNLTNQRNSNVIAAAASEFKARLAANGYSIVSKGNKLDASYNGSWITLELPLPTDYPIGGISTFNVSANGKKPKLICALTKGGGGFTISSRIVGDEPKPDEIEALKIRLANIEKTVSEFKEPELEFRVADQDAKSKVMDSPPHNSFTEALESYLN